MRRHRPASSRFTIAGVMTVALASVVSLNPAGAADVQRPVAVQTAIVAIERVAEVREVTGTVRARNTATVAAQIIGTVIEVAVHAGATVKAGQLLARLDDRASAAEYQRAQADRRRYEALLARQAATRAEYEEVMARYQTAEAAWSHTRVTAPMDGILAARLVDPGDMAEPGKPLFIVEQAGSFQLVTEVPERIASSVAEGNTVQVHIDASAEDCTGTVAELVPAADPVTRGFAAKIDLACRQPLRSGTLGRVRFEVSSRDALVVPAAAVHQIGQLTYVFVIDADHARMRLVRTGRSRSDGAVEILAGLAAGDRIVIGADAEIVDGSPVTATEHR